MLDSQPFLENKEAATLAQAIVDTVREPLLVLDKDLVVLAASRSFYLTFKVAKAETIGRPLYALGDGQWDIPRLRLLLEVSCRSMASWTTTRSSMISPAGCHFNDAAVPINRDHRDNAVIGEERAYYQRP
jgi:hypothetical protein